jgi:glycosyltransferase involved in cell wall biosynthesis
VATDKRLRTLLISPTPVFPYLDAPGQRTYHFLRTIARIHKVHLVQQYWPKCSGNQVVGPPDAELGWLEQTCVAVHQVPRETRRRMLRYGSLYRSLELESLLAQVLQRRQFDVVWGVSYSVAYYLREFEMSTLVLDGQDCVDLAYRRMLRNTRGKLQWAKLLIKWGLRYLYTRRFLRHIPYFTVVAEPDAASLRRLVPQAEVRVISNGVDAEFFAVSQDHSAMKTTPPTAVFVGAMGASHNSDAATFFVREILPLVQAQIPDFRFQVVGKDPGPGVQELAKMPGVEITGYVPDIRPYLWAADVFVAPSLPRRWGAKPCMLGTM